MSVDRAPTPVGDDVDAGYPRRMLLTILAAIVVFSSSMTIVAASLPTIADDLGSSESVLAWSVTGMFLMMAVGTPVLGRLGDVHGHRRVFLAGAMVLSAGTILCGIAPTALTFVLARMVVGGGIAATMPTAMALIMETYGVDRRSEAMGWFQMVMTGAPVMGLVAGGPLIEAFGWRSVFLVLSPVSVLGVAAAMRVIRASPSRADELSIDWAGAGALAVATLGFLLFLERGGAVGFGDPLGLGLATVSVVAVIAFVRLERRAPSPMLRLGYLRRPNFTGPLVAQALAQFAYMGGFLISPLLLDELFGYSVSAIALVLLFRPGSFSISSPIGGRLARRTGERALIIAGSVLMATSMGMWILAALWVNLPLVLAGLVLSGLALGIASPSYATVIAGAVEPADLGIASGMNATVMNIGMLTGIQAMFVTLGDGREPADFALVFGLGGAVAAIGLIGALAVRSIPEVGQRGDPVSAA